MNGDTADRDDAVGGPGSRGGREAAPDPAPETGGADGPAEAVLTFRISSREIQEALAWQWRTTGALRVHRLTGVAVLTLTTAVTVVKRGDVSFMVPAFGAVFFLIAVVLAPMLWKRQAGRLADRLGELRTRVDASGVTVHNDPGAVTHRPWPSHSGYAETPGLFLLVEQPHDTGARQGAGKRRGRQRRTATPTQFVMLPKHAVAVTPGVDAFRELLDRRLPRL